MNRVVFVCLTLLLFFVAGCTTAIVPPPKAAHPATVYVTNYGRHSSLLLPEDNDHWVEYAFGDWEWFAQWHKSSSGVFRAFFFSKYSCLGRREIKLAGATTQSDDAVAQRIGSKVCESVLVPRDRADTLRTQLDDLHHAHIDTVIFNPNVRLWFVKYRGGYWLFHNCNQETADWLRSLGCQIHGTAMFSTFRVRER